MEWKIFSNHPNAIIQQCYKIQLWPQVPSKKEKEKKIKEKILVDVYFTHSKK